MDSEQIRQLNAIYWEGVYGGKALAAKMDCTQGYISQLVRGHGSFGQRAARSFEQALELPHGWMDFPHPEIYPDNMDLPDDMAQITELLSFWPELASLPTDKLRRVKDLIHWLESEN